MVRGIWGFVVLVSLVSNTVADEILRFGESPIGYVTVSPATGSEEGFSKEIKPSFCRQAVGTISVPEDGLLGIELVGSKIADPSQLKLLPPRTCLLKVTHASLTAEHMAKLGVLGELIRIDFEKCKFSSDAFDALGLFPKLRACHVSSEGTLGDSEQSFAAWVSRQTQLEQLVVIPQMSSSSILQLTKLPKLKAVHASLDANAVDTLNALKQVQSMEFLNVSVAQGCPPEALDLVGELRQLRSYRQVLGKVSSHALNRLAEHGRLEQLDLAIVDLTFDSLNHISKIQTLKALNVVASESNQSNELDSKLVRICDELPRLVSWPRLTKVSKDDLAIILSRTDIESLSLTRIDQTLDVRALGGLANLSNLRELKIEGIPVDDVWLKKISVLPKLELLQLFDTRVVGHGFTNFAGHPSLRKLIIFVGSLDDAHIDFDLTALAESNVEDLQMMGPFGKESLHGIAGMRSLRQLRLFGDLVGFSDDSLTKQLSQLPQLRELYMTGNCFITDAGAHELAQLNSLQALAVSGFVTEKGAVELSKIPSLRQLSIASSKIDSKFTQDLPYTWVRAFDGNVDEQGLSSASDLETGADGILRKTRAKELDKIRQLEGHLVPNVTVTSFGRGSSFHWEDYRGKVVLIDFWGTWCGPCRFQMPKLQTLYKKYRTAGLEIVSIHTSNGSENLEEYLASKDLPWVHLVDDNEVTVSSFHVPHYPSIFLVDRAGTLRVALAHPKGLDDAIEKLLSVPPQ